MRGRRSVSTRANASAGLSRDQADQQPCHTGPAHLAAPSAASADTSPAATQARPAWRCHARFAQRRFAAWGTPLIMRSDSTRSGSGSREQTFSGQAGVVRRRDPLMLRPLLLRPRGPLLPEGPVAVLKRTQTRLQLSRSKVHHPRVLLRRWIASFWNKVTWPRLGRWCPTARL